MMSSSIRELGLAVMPAPCTPQHLVLTKLSSNLFPPNLCLFAGNAPHVLHSWLNGRGPNQPLAVDIMTSWWVFLRTRIHRTWPQNMLFCLFFTEVLAKTNHKECMPCACFEHFCQHLSFIPWMVVVNFNVLKERTTK